MSNRPYYIVHNGVPRMIEASSPAQAVRHAVGAAITELRPARGGEVLAWQKSGKPFEDANAPQPAPEADEDLPTKGKGWGNDGYTHADVIAFVQEKMGVDDSTVMTDEQSKAMAILHTARVADQLTLEQYDELRPLCRAFTEALSLYSFLGRASVDEVRRHLEAEPMKWEMLERSVASFLQDKKHWSDRTHGADSAVDDDDQAVDPILPTAPLDSAE